MPKLLGLSFGYHDSASALVIDGVPVAAALEERFSRKKHDSSFPKLAASFCLSQAGFRNVNELDAVVFHEKPSWKFLRILENFAQTWPNSYRRFSVDFPLYLKDKLNVRAQIRRNLPGFRGKILFSDHHLSHAAFGYFTSPFEDAAILTIDGVGETATVGVFEGKKNTITARKSIAFPDSLGLFYSAVTAYLGFGVNDGEWKVMGLAAYGKPTYLECAKKMLRCHEDGSFSLERDYFALDGSDNLAFDTRRWEALLGFPPRLDSEPVLPCHQNLAASFQILLEDVILRMAKEVSRDIPSKNVVLSGGVFLNGLANDRIARAKLFERTWIAPAPGDDGSALGAALAAEHMHFETARNPRPVTMSLGPEYSETHLEHFIAARGLKATRHSGDELATILADELCDGRIVGQFYGRMEFGPRALGNRSILADPRRANAKAVLNDKIKLRESFRPFAPVVLDEFKNDYFELVEGSDYAFMNHVVPVRADKRDLIPAVTHEDGTARVQTLKPEINPALEGVLRAFQKRTGVGALVNTSFNLNKEPIVCSPDDAVDCFLKSGIDVLTLGNYLVRSKECSDRQSEHPVNAFYHDKPFNGMHSPIEAAINIRKKNQIRSYPYLHRELKSSPKPPSILEIGCGSGWFLNSVAHFYGAHGVGIDLNPKGIQAASETKLFLNHAGMNNFQVCDLFSFQSKNKFDIVSSLGVLHHTGKFEAALKKASSLVGPDGHLHIGLYHLYGRRPFLDHFKTLVRERGQQAAFQEFCAMLPKVKDEKQIKSWFEDQVNHPLETLHTLEEVLDLLGNQFELRQTSLNGFHSAPAPETLATLEKAQEKIGQRNLRSKRFYPGFFTAWLKRIS